MAKLPKSIIKKYGITKKAWSVFRGTNKKIKTRGVRMARHKRYGRMKKYAKKSLKSFSFGNAIKIVAGAGIAVLYEVYVSPMIPLSGIVKNIVELALGLFIASMSSLPTMVRAGGVAIATLNAFQILYPMLQGSGTANATSLAVDY
jgi:hypothetical protein